MSPRRACSISSAALAFAVLACRIPNEDHCGRRSGDETCLELDPARPYCSLCEAEHDGCVESLAKIPADCRGPGAAEIGGETTQSEADEETGETGATETDTTSECGNGIKEAGEDCDGEDFGDATCTDPYQLPAGTLVCVPGECVIATSQCCLLEGELCEPGECCDANCNPITNKCGL